MTLAPSIAYFLTYIYVTSSLDSTVYLTKYDFANPLSKQPGVLTFKPDTNSGGQVVDVDDATTYQIMDGFGAALTDSSANVIWNKMSAKQREKLLQDLFNPTTGIGLNILRLPMGASDFALSRYTYDDTCCDLSDFSIQHDLEYIVPILKRVKEIQPDLLLFASPWSPPAWMKLPKNLIGGTLQPEFYDLYAQYFVKFIEAYKEQDLPIYAVTVQNEPNFSPSSYPGMIMNASQQTTFIRDHLGPALATLPDKPKILVWDHNWDHPEYPLKVLGDKKTYDYVAGTGFHCYGGAVSAQTQVHDAYPDKDVWQTECADKDQGQTGDGTIPPVFREVLSSLIISGPRNWGKSVIKWNLALDEHNGPRTGGSNTTVGTVRIDSVTGNVQRLAEYYSTGHASKFVRKGAVRIKSSYKFGGLETVAFKNPDSTIVLIVLNHSDSPISFKVRYHQQSFPYSLESSAAATFIWK